MTAYNLTPPREKHQKPPLIKLHEKHQQPPLIKLHEKQRIRKTYCRGIAEHTNVSLYVWFVWEITTGDPIHFVLNFDYLLKARHLFFTDRMVNSAIAKKQQARSEFAK